MAYKPPPVNPYGSAGYKPPPKPKPPPVNPYGSAGYKPTPDKPRPESGSAGGGGGSFDPRESPEYRQLAELFRRMNEEEARNVKMRIAQAMAYYGSPDDPLSLFGRLAEAFGLEQKAIPAQLAARGLFRSGTTAYRLNRSRLDYQRRQLDLNRQLSEFVQALRFQLAQNIMMREAQLVQAAWNAALQMALTGAVGGSSGGGTSSPPSSPPPSSPPPSIGKAPPTYYAEPYLAVPKGKPYAV
jgi:hypothetical protein